MATNPGSALSSGVIYMVVAVVVISLGSSILTGTTMSTYYNNVASLDANANVSDIYILFLQLLPWVIVLGLFATFLALALLEFKKVKG